MIVVKDPVETEGGSSSPVNPNNLFMQKVQHSLGFSASPIIVRRSLTANNHSPIMHSLKPPQAGAELDLNLQRTRANTRSPTPFLSHNLLPSLQDKDKDFISSYGGQSEIKSRGNIEGILEAEGSLVLNETNSPVKSVIRRQSSPNVFEEPTRFMLKDQTITEEEQKETNESFGKNHRKNTDYILTTTERKDDSAIYLNQNTSYVNTTKVFVSNVRKGEIDLDTSMNTKKPDTDDVLDLSIKMPRIRKINTITDEVPSSKRRWGKVSLLFRSLIQFNREEVKPIDDAQGVLNEINNYNLRTWNVPSNKKRDLAAQDFARDSFDLIRRVQAFCECATIGSAEHIQLMQKIIDDDPKKFMLEPIDPSHLLNRKNSFGHTPMYIAAKNGNLEVLKLLVSNKANHNLSSTIEPSEKSEESPLEVAVKWNHKAVVEFLLDNCEYSFNVLRKCLFISPNLEIKQILREHIRHKFRRKLSFLFCCFKG